MTSQWQPIETAPKDGTAFVGTWWDEKTARSPQSLPIAKVFWSRLKERWIADTHGYHPANPTHWMPLPEPPAEKVG